MKVDDLARKNWLELCSYMPGGWEAKLHELGVLKFGRKFSGKEGASALLRMFLIHLAGNVSLRSTCAIAREGGIADISDVALLKRLKKAEPWFTWTSNELLAEMHLRKPEVFAAEGQPYRWRILDASVIDEPGATGTKWRLHYSLDAETLAPDEILATDHRCGEKLSNFTIRAKDVLIADRAYGTRQAIADAADREAHVLLRLIPGNVPLHDSEGNGFQLLKHLRRLEVGEVAGYDAFIHYEGKRLPVRICAIRKSEDETEKARKKVRRKASKQGTKKIKDATLEYAGYVLLLTSLPDAFSPKRVLAIYRYRWQIELIFKRLKSLIGASPLHKKSPEGMRGWLSGKVFVAVLTHYMLRVAEAFSPWGYPLRDARGR